jgi:hypothetical protein
MRFERQTAEKKKYGAIEPLVGKPEIDRLMDEYRSYQRTTQRFWDDVAVGDKLPPVLKGPLTPTSEIAFESFFGVYLVGNVVAARLYDKHPALMIPNEQGVPEPPQRVHWDNAFTNRLLGLVLRSGPAAVRTIRRSPDRRRPDHDPRSTAFAIWASPGPRRGDGGSSAAVHVGATGRNHRDEITAKGVAEAAMVDEVAIRHERLQAATPPHLEIERGLSSGALTK